MAPFLAISASILALVAAAWYNRDLLQSRIRPNLSSWLVWSFVTALSTSSYFAANTDVTKSLLSFANSAATIITLFLIFWRGRFSRINASDRIAATIGTVSGLVWLFSRSAAWGNLIIQFAIVTGSIPTYHSVLQDPLNERPGPWMLWGISGLLATVVVVLRWTHKPLELVYPILGVLIYGGIGLIALRRKK